MDKVETGIGEYRTVAGQVVVSASGELKRFDYFRNTILFRIGSRYYFELRDADLRYFRERAW